MSACIRHFDLSGEQKKVIEGRAPSAFPSHLFDLDGKMGIEKQCTEVREAAAIQTL